MKIDAVSINGKVSEFEISEKIFSSTTNKKLINHVLYSQVANMKPRLAKTKQRNEIKGSTAKIYAQKGTGNARHASRKAPIFVGGGIAHGPKGNVYKVRKINKKQSKFSIIGLVSQKNKDKNLIVIDDVKDKITKTKIFYKFLKTNQITNALIVTDSISRKNIELSARNIPNIKLTNVSFLNAFNILKYNQIIFTKTSTKELEKRLLNND